MLRSVDLVCLLHRSVIEPQYDIAVIAVFVVKVRPSDSNRLVRVVPEDSERARSIEANAANGALVDIVLVHCTAD